MKKIKFKQLATLSLCCSLMMNSLIGITAFAETVTIESSPTQESTENQKVTASEGEVEDKGAIIKKESSEEKKQETTSSQLETKVQKEQTVEEQTEPTQASKNLVTSRGLPLKDQVYPNVQYDFVDETGNPFTEPLYFYGNYQAFKGGDVNSTPVPLPAPYNKLSAQNNGSGSYILSVSNGSAMPFTEQTIANYGGGGTNPVVKYRTMFILDKLNIATPLKFVDSIEYDFVNSNWALYLYTGFNATTGIFDNSVEEAKTLPMSETSKDAKFQKNAQGYFEIIQPSTFAISSGDVGGWTVPGYSNIRLFGFDGTNTIKSKMIYKVTRKQVTEKFVDGTGVAITPPTGFTQNKKTPMTSNNFTYTSAKALPERYSADGKNYKFKGWYKGTTKPADLQTSKTPSYAVTYDDQDDMTAVYEVEKTTILPGATYQFGFVDDSGNIVDPSKIGFNYDLWSIENKVSTIEEKNLTGTNVGDYKNMTIADKVILEPVVANGNSVYSPINVTFTLPKYYSAMAPNDGKNSKYPIPNITAHRSDTGTSPVTPSATAFAVAKVAGKEQAYALSNTNSAAVPDIKYPRLYRRYAVPLQFTYYTNYNTFSGPVYYTLTQRKVTEHFVDSDGTKITPPEGFTQGNQIKINSETFTYTSEKELPEFYKVDGKTYKFKGWYKGTTKPATLEETKKPTYAVTYDDNDDMTAVYEVIKPTATLNMIASEKIVASGTNLDSWSVKLKNTSETPINEVTIKPTADWNPGISVPTELLISGGGQTAQTQTVTKEQWTAGFKVPLNVPMPAGTELTINLLGTTVTGKPNQVLKAAVAVTGDFGTLSASDTVRIKDDDQVITNPEGEGFISTPTFDFGKISISSTTKQHGLKKAADYYGNGARNPYLRLKKTQPNWSLTAQLSQPKSASDSLPTSTRLLLGSAPVSSVDNYNQPTELLTQLGTTSDLVLTANNTATTIIANKQFIGKDVYQLDFAFDKVKLEVPANQGKVEEKYQGTVTWNLVTGP